jgi:hypothetical protein
MFSHHGMLLWADGRAEIVAAFSVEARASTDRLEARWDVGPRDWRCLGRGCGTVA